MAAPLKKHYFYILLFCLLIPVHPHLEGSSGSKTYVPSACTSQLSPYQKSSSHTQTFSVQPRVGTSYVRHLDNLPLKALLTFLVLQSGLLPSANAQSVLTTQSTMTSRVTTTKTPAPSTRPTSPLVVTNLNQTLFYGPDGDAVPLLPMTVTGPNRSIRFDIYLQPNSTAGIVNSTSNHPLQRPGTTFQWLSIGNLSQINDLVQNLYFRPNKGIKEIIRLDSFFGDPIETYVPTKGYIILYPLVTNQSSPSTTTSYLTTSVSAASQSLKTIPPLTSTQLQVTSSEIEQSIRTEQDSFNAQKSTPTLSDSNLSIIIGSTVGGVILCAGTVVGVLLYRQKRKRSSTAKIDAKPVDNDHQVAAKMSSPYASISHNQLQALHNYDSGSILQPSGNYVEFPQESTRTGDYESMPLHQLQTSHHYQPGTILQ